MAYELSVGSDNSHWHLDEELFINKQTHVEILEMISEECDKSREISIVHYKATYTEPTIPPIWMLIEILSFGQCVKICKSLKREYKNKISRTFDDEDEQFIMSWMHCLFALRNNCAHHSRLWNRNFVFTPKSDHKKYHKYFVAGNKRLFNQLVVLQILLKKINPTSSWLIKFKDLINDHKIEINEMGLPDDWENRLTEIIKL
jgi:abortive infection bacteriophage resistance protein